jgi:proteasome alpha subunit
VKLGVAALAGDDRELPTGELEVAALARGNGRRCFLRVSEAEVAEILS